MSAVEQKEAFEAALTQSLEKACSLEVVQAGLHQVAAVRGHRKGDLSGPYLEPFAVDQVGGAEGCPLPELPML